jgi:rod shape-determining protein MreC
MESLLHRYRNITVLFIAIIAQIAAVAWQVRRDNDVPLLRIWAVSAVTPVASVIENLRSGTFGVFTDFFSAHGSRDQSRQLRTERDKLKLENQLLQNELAEAQRAGSLAGFQAHSPSKMIGARVIGATTGMSSRSVLIDRGSVSGVRKGMAVVTPDGIVGKVLEVYPFASQVLTVTDAGFAAAVESQKNHTRGVLQGMGSVSAKVDYVPPGQKVEKGETFFTSGEDRVFPRGMPVGKVTAVGDGGTFQDIFIEPFGAEAAPEEVFVIVDPVHQEIPDVPPTDSPVFLGPDPKSADANSPDAAVKGTQADQIVDQYRKIGAAQNHEYGGGAITTSVPNFNLKVPGVNAPAAAPGASGAAGSSGTIPRRLAMSASGPARMIAPGASGAPRPVARAASGAPRP